MCVLTADRLKLLQVAAVAAVQRTSSAAENPNATWTNFPNTETRTQNSCFTSNIVAESNDNLDSVHVSFDKTFFVNDSDLTERIELRGAPNCAWMPDRRWPRPEKWFVVWWRAFFFEHFTFFFWKSLVFTSYSHPAGEVYQSTGEIRANQNQHNCTFRGPERQWPVATTSSRTTFRPIRVELPDSWEVCNLMRFVNTC